MTTTEVKDIDVTFVVKLSGLNIAIFFNTQLHLNEDDNNFDVKLKDIHYKRTVGNLHDDGWKNIFSNSAGVSMLGYGCGVSQYPQFYDKELYRYQVLPRPYRGSFEGLPGYKFVKEKCLIDLADQVETFFWESIKNI